MGSARNEAAICWMLCLVSSSSVPWAPSACAFDTAALTALIMPSSRWSIFLKWVPISSLA